MQEKEPIKVRLSTVILLFIVFVLIGGIIVYFVIQNNSLKISNTKSESEVNQLNERLNRLEQPLNETDDKTSNTVKDTKTSNEENKNVEKAADEGTKDDKYKEITKELDEEEIFKFQQLEEKDGKYILKGVIKEVYKISADELKDISSKGKMTYDGKSYTVKKDEEGRYGLYLKNNDIEQFYFRKEDKNTYYLESNTEYSTVWKETNNYKKITLDGNTKCTYSKDSNIDKTDTVKNVFTKKLYWNGYFKFTFKNGKCTSVNEVVIGH